MRRAINVDISDDYTDLLIHNTGSTKIQFSNETEQPIDDVSKVELIAYDIPCRKNTVDATNDSLDFEVGPYVFTAAVADPGYGYDMWNAPQMHVTSYRSTIPEENIVDNDWNNRSVNGMYVNSDREGVSIVASSTQLAQEGLEQTGNQQDSLQMGCELDLNGSVSHVYVVRPSTYIRASNSVYVDMPFDYPYAIHISDSNEFKLNSPRMYTDVVKLYRAFDTFVRSGSADIHDLGFEIAWEINHALGWDVTPQSLAEYNALGPTVAFLASYYDASGNVQYKYTDASDARWSAKSRNMALTHIKYTPNFVRDNSNRYQCKYEPTIGFQLYRVDSASAQKHFRITPQLFDGLVSYESGIVQFAKKTFLEHSRVAFQAPNSVYMHNDGKDDPFVSSYLASALKANGFACVTTLMGILGFAPRDTMPSSMHDQMTNDRRLKTVLMPNGTVEVKHAYQTIDDNIQNMWAYLQKFRSRRRATIMVSTLKATARLRHGVYSIGTVLHQNFRHEGSTAMTASREIYIRQAGDGLIKELQDQMNMAYFGSWIQRKVYDASSHAWSSYEGPDHGRRFALHYPHQLEPSSAIYPDTPHMFAVSLEDADVYNGISTQTASNMRSNQNRKTRVRISFVGQRFIADGQRLDTGLSYTYTGKNDDAALIPTRLTLTLRNGTGPSTSRSIANMLGFESTDVSDEQFVEWYPTPNTQPPANPDYMVYTLPRYTYGCQAPSVYDTQVRTKACVIKIGLNQGESFKPLAVAMVAGRTDHANITCNTDGSVQSFLTETNRMSGFNRASEVASDNTKRTLFVDPKVSPIVSSFIRPPSQDNLNTLVFRAIDWGARVFTLDRRYTVKEIHIQLRDGKTNELWPANASETCFVLLRLHHPRKERNMVLQDVGPKKTGPGRD